MTPAVSLAVPYLLDVLNLAQTRNSGERSAAARETKPERPKQFHEIKTQKGNETGKGASEHGARLSRDSGARERPNRFISRFSLVDDAQFLHRVAEGFDRALKRVSTVFPGRGGQSREGGRKRWTITLRLLRFLLGKH